MNKLIGYCGLNCLKCEARIATINNDNNLRIKVAKEWSILNNCEILPEFINCTGCKSDGIKTPFCESMCEVKKCALNNNYETCRDCNNKKECLKLKPFLNNEEALKNIEI